MGIRQSILVGNPEESSPKIHNNGISSQKIVHQKSIFKNDHFYEVGSFGLERYVKIKQNGYVVETFNRQTHSYDGLVTTMWEFTNDRSNF